MNMTDLKNEIHFMRWMFLFFIAVSVWTWAVDIPETREAMQYYKKYHDDDYAYLHRRFDAQDSILGDMEASLETHRRVICLLSAQEDLLEGNLRIVNKKLRF